MNRRIERNVECRKGPIHLWTPGVSQRFNSNELGKNSISNNGTRSIGIHTDKMNPDLYKTPYKKSILEDLH